MKGKCKKKKRAAQEEKSLFEYLQLQGINIREKYHFYHDETNNYRRLILNEEGTKFNNDPHKVFVLGGVCYPKERPVSLSIEELRSEFNLQPSVKELKFSNHFSKGDFLATMQNKRTLAFLQWLSKSGLYIHYDAVELLYFSLTDIVDTLVYLRLEDFGTKQLFLKNAFYKGVLMGEEEFLRICNRFNYPSVSPSDFPTFISEVWKLIKPCKAEDPYWGDLVLLFEEALARKTDLASFLEDSSPNVFASNFLAFYLQQIIQWPKAFHTFDIETNIQELFSKEMDRNGKIAGHYVRDRFEFVDSKEEPLVQASDVVAGLMGQLYSYAATTESNEIVQSLAKADKIQKESIDLLSFIWHKTNYKNPGLIAMQLPIDAARKVEAILGFYNHRSRSDYRFLLY